MNMDILLKKFVFSFLFVIRGRRTGGNSGTKDYRELFDYSCSVVPQWYVCF